MSEKTIRDLLKEHSFFAGFRDDHLDLVAGCGKNTRFEGGDKIAGEGDPADTFFVIRNGLLAIETNVPGRGPVRLQTLGPGEILGWSWIFPPYKWSFDAFTLERTLAVALDGKCLREKCEADAALGYAMMKHFAQIMTRRLMATRLQVIDLYGGP